MKIVVLDGYTLNPGDLSWEGLERLGDIITPHIAWASKEARTRLMKTAVENLVAFFNGFPENVINI